MRPFGLPKSLESQICMNLNTLFVVPVNRLAAYLERRYPEADAAEKSAFERFLSLPDPVLIDYLLNRKPAEDPAIANVVEHVLRQDFP